MMKEIVGKKQIVVLRDLGNVPFKETWDLQESLLKTNSSIKLDASFDTPPLTLPTQHYLLLCEHPHVYTLGKSGKEEHLLINHTRLKDRGATFFRINRGGDITYHGPGQMVAYPILDLEKFKRDLHWYLRTLEESIILLLADYGLAGRRIEGATGVWLDTDGAYPRKICAMGIRCSRWITMHGLALNVNTDLSYFRDIVPCGISDKDVTSLQAELGQVMDMNEIKAKWLTHVSTVFNLILV